MTVIKNLIQNNEKWRTKVLQDNPQFFLESSKTHNPCVFWIGCSDSRVPVETIVGMEPGQVFVHRNVANLVHYADMNLLTTLNFAISVLQVKDIVVCGHYGCHGVKSALTRQNHDLVDHWLRAIKDTCHDYEKELDKLESFENKHDRLVELNTIRQIQHVCYTPFVQQRWADGHELSVHALVYDLKTGRLKDLNCSIDNIEQIKPQYRLDLTRLED